MRAIFFVRYRFVEGHPVDIWFLPARLVISCKNSRNAVGFPGKIPFRVPDRRVAAISGWKMAVQAALFLYG